MIELETGNVDRVIGRNRGRSWGEKSVNERGANRGLIEFSASFVKVLGVDKKKLQTERSRVPVPAFRLFPPGSIL